MSKPARIASILALSIASLIVVIFIAAIIVVQTAWFQNFVREKIIAVTEESTGGKVDLASFTFDPWHLRAVIRGFVIHGAEPAAAPPLFQAKMLQVDLKILASLEHTVDLRQLIIDQPAADVIVYPDGSTNIPSPKVKKKSDKSGLETVVDLAIGKFDLRNGSFIFADKKIPLNAKGENLTAQLFYNTVNPSYQGRVSIQPLIVDYAHHQPLDLNVTVPVTLAKDSITVQDAKIGTAHSGLVLNASIKNMNSPATSARLNGKVALRDIEQVSGLKISDQAGKTLPGIVDAEIAVNMDQNSIRIDAGRLTLGESSIEASGPLKDPSGQGSLAIKSSLALGQLGRLFELPQRPEGVVHLNANAKLGGNKEYLVAGNVVGRNLAFRQDGKRYSNIDLVSALHVDPHRIELNGLKLDAFGGELAGNVAVADMRRVDLDANLRNLDLNTAARAFTGKDIGYDGIVSGPIKASGDLKAPGATGFVANANLTIAPGPRGQPVSGRIVAHYNGAVGAVQLDNSYLALAHSRLNLSGSLGQTVHVHFTSSNLNDFLAALRISSPQAKEMPVALKPGSAITFDGTISGALAAPQIAGRVAMGPFTAEGRAFDKLAADLSASPSNAALQNAVITRGPSQIYANATIGLRDWKALPRNPVNVNAGIRNGDLADLVALAGQKNIDVAGALNATAHIGGTLGNPQGGANITIANGAAYGQPIDRAQAQINFSDQLVTLQNASLISGPSRIEASATFRHPHDSFSTGHIDARVATNQVQLAHIKPVAERRPGLSGALNANASVSANLKDVNGKTEFQLQAVNGDFNIRGLQADGNRYGDLTATARTTGNVVNYRVVSDFAGSTIDAAGETRLVTDYPTTLDASIRALPIQRALAIAGRSDLPAAGNLTGNVRLAGTIAKPQANVDVTLANAVLYDEPFHRIDVRASYAPQAIDVPALNIVAPAGTIQLSAHYTHAPDDLEHGAVKINIKSSDISLGQFRTIQKFRPGLGGTLRLVADAAATVRRGPDNKLQALLSTLNGNMDVTTLSINKRNLGNIRLAANTRGDSLSWSLDSNLAGSKIEGSGRATLRDDYPVDGRLTFAHLTYSGLAPLMQPGNETSSAFEVVLDGDASVNGPILKIDALAGKFELTRLNVSAKTTPAARPVTFQNQGPIVLTLRKSMITIAAAHITGRQTDIKIGGAASLNPSAPMDITVAANTDLGILEDISRDIYSSGAIALNAVVRGSVAKPLINGRLDLKNASFNYASMPNGIANANGAILFNGTSATIQQFTAESGGGKLTASGFLSFGGPLLAYGLKATATDVRVRYSGASVTSNANVSLSGTSERSIVSGTVTIRQIGFAPQQDFGSLLNQGGGPPQAPSAPSGPLAGMRLDVRIRTAPDVSFQTPLAQNLQASANLTLRGTASQPGMLGRVSITQGQLIFFGSKYTVNQGSINFYDPNNIKPVLNIDLQTNAKGVDVVLNISGPVDNMKLTYHSDPPLQFQELVALLATGRTPTSDPTLLANQPSTPPQSFQQMGESAIVSQAIANPLSNRLERVFGVSQLKIDPTFVSGSELPQARLTLQQQITSNLTFTYITNLQQSNDLIIRIEWALSPRWSAIATREENGMFGIDFFYKRRFR
ncbi:MAG TPA: translocation/assembly module TamB domain-containing protein [Bryobacteraceae bacterium]|nr:translocation/assembly module TamB domain-containing protein [Bryobacteraceae bacterium]